MIRPSFSLLTRTVLHGTEGWAGMKTESWQQVGVCECWGEIVEATTDRFLFVVSVARSSPHHRPPTLPSSSRFTFRIRTLFSAERGAPRSVGESRPARRGSSRLPFVLHRHRDEIQAGFLTEKCSIYGTKEAHRPKHEQGLFSLVLIRR